MKAKRISKFYIFPHWNARENIVDDTEFKGGVNLHIILSNQALKNITAPKSTNFLVCNDSSFRLREKNQ